MLNQTNAQKVRHQPSTGVKLILLLFSLGSLEEPARILENTSSSIDLLFTTQPNMVLQSMVLFTTSKQSLSNNICQI